MDCVFCRIRDGAIPSVRLHEDERTLAIMDINPLNDGHLLVIARTHTPTLFDIPEHDLTAVILAAKRLAVAVRAALRPDGLSVMQTNGEAAFQSVSHFHVHLVPRWIGDGKGLDWTPAPGDLDHIRATGDKIRTALERASRAPPS